MGVVHPWPCQKLTKGQDEGSGGSSSLGCGPGPSARILPGGGTRLPHHDAVEQIEKLEKCWGEDNMRNYMVEIKKALAKCQQTDAPELELPIFRSPFKFVSSLIAGANEREQQLFNIVSRMAKQQQGSNFYPAPPDTLHNQYNPNHRVPSQYNPNHQVPSQNNVFELLEQINQDNIADSHRTQSPFTYAKFHNSKYRGFQPAMDLPGTYSVKVESRFKRQADGGSNNGFLNLLDQLAEKIKVVEKTEEEEIGNYTCVLRHLHFLDHNNDLDLRAMINTIDNHQNANKWLKEQQIQNYQTCYQMAENMPRHEQPVVEEGKPNMAKHQLFFQCLSKQSYETCMHHDLRTQIEHNFGPVDLLLKQTQLTEVELYRLVFEIIYRDTLDFF